MTAIHPGGDDFSMDISVKYRGVYAFGRFRLDPVCRVLLCDDAPTKLVPRLFDLLLYLVENPGRVVEKDELLSAVWGGRIVEEANLSQAISALRKVLQAEGAAEAMIVTAPGRGYRFAAPVWLETGAAAALPADLTVAIGGPPPATPPRVAPWWRDRTTFMRGAAAALALMFALAAAWRFLAATPSTTPAAIAVAPPPHSVAVLPFANMSGDAAQDYFSDGLSEELIDTLSAIDQIHVAARVSAFSFKGTNATIPDIARKLNVGTVLEGSVRRDGARVRIAAQLIDAQTGFPLWSGSYDRDRLNDDIFKVQADIAQSVTTALKVKLLGADAAKFTLGGTHNARAFDAYLRAMVNNSPVEDDAQANQAIADFTVAIRLDPNYAAAYAGRAQITHVLVNNGTGTDVAAAQKMLADATADADRAIEIEPALADAHWARALLLGAALDLAGASAEMSRARDLAPGNAVIESIYGYSETIIGHTDAGVAALRRAVDLDPLRPSVYRNLASALVYARRDDEALDAYHHFLALDPHPSHAEQILLAIIDLVSNDPAGAEKICAGNDGFYDHEYLAIADHALGRQADSQAHLTRLQQIAGDRGAYNYAVIYAQWHEPAQALHWLQVAYTLRDPGLREMRTDPFLDPIRTTPEFQDIQKQLNFPP
jgi:TolB-like protein/DNA-binding winged helix-turn-helix (wHTH) protein/tetratricopeptide (TPR) repeat protein